MKWNYLQRSCDTNNIIKNKYQVEIVFAKVQFVSSSYNRYVVSTYLLNIRPALYTQYSAKLEEAVKAT